MTERAPRLAARSAATSRRPNCRGGSKRRSPAILPTAAPMKASRPSPTATASSSWRRCSAPRRVGIEMSFIAPILPANAPFSPLQRAWLDGFVAGLFGEGASDTVAPIAAADQEAEPQAPAPKGEDFPWHDPGLPLDERIALAAGRRPEHLLMAAMAQTDCGQCGYSCQAYAEAIASGADSNIGRCTPGGKATSRKLRELLAETAAPTPVAPSPRPAIAAAPIAAPRAADEPFPARLRAALPLNRSGSGKDTRLVVLETETGAE